MVSCQVLNMLAVGAPMRKPTFEDVNAWEGRRAARAAAPPPAPARRAAAASLAAAPAAAPIAPGSRLVPRGDGTFTVVSTGR